MTSNVLQNPKMERFEQPLQAPEKMLCAGIMRSGIWLIGVPSWLYGVTDRAIAAMADGYITLAEISQFLLASLLLISWLCLKPEENVLGSALAVSDRYKLPLKNSVNDNSIDSAKAIAPEAPDGVQARLDELHDKHMASQAYVLPFPYVCQIYHLLNLKHLEDIHSFSLGNLKVLRVASFQPTLEGGRLIFQTCLDSPLNILRIWRQPIVEVELVLHTPYTVELKIPAYGGKEIIVMFNIMPLSDREHALFIDMYSDLKWPKPLLNSILNLAASLTLLEDLPYLRALANRNWFHVLERNRVSSHQTMQLFKRFVDLYGSSLAALPATSEIQSSAEISQANAV